MFPLQQWSIPVKRFLSWRFPESLIWFFTTGFRHKEGLPKTLKENSLEMSRTVDECMRNICHFGIYRGVEFRLLGLCTMVMFSKWLVTRHFPHGIININADDNLNLNQSESIRFVSPHWRHFATLKMRLVLIPSKPWLLLCHWRQSFMSDLQMLWRGNGSSHFKQ